MMMAGRDLGFDIGTQVGAEAWLRELQHGPLPQSIPLPPAATSFRPDPAAARAKKNRRKAERKARKKNR